MTISMAIISRNFLAPLYSDPRQSYSTVSRKPDCSLWLYGLVYILFNLYQCCHTVCSLFMRLPLLSIISLRSIPAVQEYLWSTLIANHNRLLDSQTLFYSNIVGNCYRLNCVSSIFLCWMPSLWCLQMGHYLKRGPQKWAHQAGMSPIGLVSL